MGLGCGSWSGASGVRSGRTGKTGSLDEETEALEQRAPLEKPRRLLHSLWGKKHLSPARKGETRRQGQGNGPRCLSLRGEGTILSWETGPCSLSRGPSQAVSGGGVGSEAGLSHLEAVVSSAPLTPAQ